MNKQLRDKWIVRTACVLLPVLAWMQYDLVGGDCSASVSLSSMMGMTPIREPRVLTDEEHAVAAKCLEEWAGIDHSRQEREFLTEMGFGD